MNEEMVRIAREMELFETMFSQLDPEGVSVSRAAIAGIISTLQRWREIVERYQNNQ